MDLKERAERGEKMRYTDDMVFYVTNKDADGFIYRFTMTAWVVLAAQLLVAVNVLLWGSIGLIVAVLTVVHAVASLL